MSKGRVDRQERLEGWKAIAVHFGRTERTVRRWEKEEGLPVSRLRGRVFADLEEVNAWFRRRTRSRGWTSSRWLLWLGAGTAAVTIISVGAFFMRDGRDPAPVDAESGRSASVQDAAVRRSQADIADWELRGTHLVIFDSQGHELLTLEIPEARARFGRSRDAYSTAVLWDVDQDGARELLFNLAPVRDGEHRGRLLCVDGKGLRWEFLYGRPLHYGTRALDEYYTEAFLQVLEVANQDLALVVSHHYNWHPSQAALVDLKTGHLVGEYLHPGWPSDVTLFDFDRDGEQELLLGGVNNPDEGLGHPFLAVLDLPFRKPEPGAENFWGSGNGGELHYLLFPRPGMFDVIYWGPSVYAIDPKSSGEIVLRVGKRPDMFLEYTLGPELDVRDIRPSDPFRQKHNELYREGHIDHELTSRELHRWRSVRSYRTAPDANGPKVEAEFRQVVQLADASWASKPN